MCWWCDAQPHVLEDLLNYEVQFSATTPMLCCSANASLSSSNGSRLSYLSDWHGTYTSSFNEMLYERHGIPIGPKERERALKSFKSETTLIIVATDVAARGLDIPSVAHVINFNLPRDIGDYVHRIGRTGRAGKSGLATAFFNNKNLSISKALIEVMEDSHQEVLSWLC